MTHNDVSYTIEIRYRNCPRPMKWDGESEEEFNSRYKRWETELKEKSFWRALARTGVDSDITRQQHMAIESPLFDNSQNGETELFNLMCNMGVALSKRQHDQKNEIANLAEVS